MRKAVRVISYMLRWSSKLCNTSDYNVISAAEISKATIIIIRFTQNSIFQDEFNQLTNNASISKGSKLLSLNHHQDDVIRVGGRLQNADIPFEARHPIIIPKKSRFTDLLIADAHITTMHGSVALMVSHLRTQYWVIDVRNSVRHHIHKCNKCFQFTSKPLQQLLGELPKPRVNIANPLSHTDIDYAGPI